jgi:glucokinase
MALVLVHYGLGSGLVIDGQILRGAYAAAGQISEMTFITHVDPNGFHTEIRDLGSLLTEPSLIRDGIIAAQEAQQHELAAYLRGDAPDKLDRLFAEVRAGNTTIKAFMHERAVYLGIGLANLINMLNPELILLAGNVYSKGHDIMLKPTQEAVDRWTFGDLGNRVKLVVVPPDRPIGVIGAAAFALDNFFYRQGGGEVVR